MYERQVPLETLRPSLRMLSESQQRAVHNQSLDILAGTGIVMKLPAAREILLAAGAWEAGDRIKIPPHLVAAALSSAPPRIPMHDRLGRPVMPLEADRVYFGTGSDCIFTVDPMSGARRQATAADVEQIARLTDGLENIDFIMSMGTPSDVPGPDVYLHGFINLIRGSSKPLVYTARDRADMEDIYRIACAVAGGERELREKPFLLLYAEPISPLLFPEESVDKLLFCAEKGIPVGYIPSPNTGGGGPITVAGALALGNAECLAGLVLTQLVRPGAPFLYGMNIATLDLRSTIVAYGCPEWAATIPAVADMARFYNLPSWGAAGATDSKVVDAQAGAEAALTVTMAFLARANLNHDVGYIEYGSTSSMEMIVMVDEIVRDVRRVMEGVEVSERTLARDAVAAAQPGSGFLAAEHTLENWRWAQWQPMLFDRLRYDAWERRGRKDLAARANERARQILESHRPAALPADAEAAIEQALRQRARRPVPA